VWRAQGYGYPGEKGVRTIPETGKGGREAEIPRMREEGEIGKKSSRGSSYFAIGKALRDGRKKREGGNRDFGGLLLSLPPHECITQAEIKGIVMQQ